MTLREVIHERTLGLTPKGKLIGQFGFGIFALVVVNFMGVEPTVQIPFLPAIDLGVLTTVIQMCLISSRAVLKFRGCMCCSTILLGGLSNAVNLTDGLDGLAARAR